MRFLPHAIVVASIAAAAPLFAQDKAARLEAMTCRDFLALDAKGQETVKAAMLAHASGEAIPDTPLPAPADTAAADGAATGPEAKGHDPADASGASGTGAPEVLEGDNESGKTAPDGTEASVTDEPGDRRLVAMRTSCEGGPDARALDGLRAAFGNNI